MNNHRRLMLQAALGLPACAAGLGSMASLLPGSAAAAAPHDYKALVCLFMGGGNDSHNWVIPTHSSDWRAYSIARAGLALPQASLRALSRSTLQDAGRSFAMPSDLSPLWQLYEQGEMAVMANVGPLLRPTSKADFQAQAALPPKLFSHNDQQSTWQAMAPEGATSGWGGRLADPLAASNAQPLFTSVSTAGNFVFLSGSRVTQYQMGLQGAVEIAALRRSNTLGSSNIASALRRGQTDLGSNLFQGEVSRVLARSVEAERALMAAMAGQPMPVLPANVITTSQGSMLQLDRLPLAQQLRSVARMMACSQALGMRRQIFMVSMGGFDTHAQQRRDEPALMAGVAHSVAWFMSELRRQGLSEKMTLFTASDFGRTLTSNGSGSDHGWGSHHFVAGGAVRGGQIYGRFPSLELGSPDEIGSGRLLPSTSVAQYASTLGRWMGASHDNLVAAAPGLSNFSQTDLGFLPPAG
jgi:uncharacterized protein (DUF1501 family)